MWVACAVLFGFALARPAGAWQESHEATDDVRVQVDPDGTAHFEHALSYRVVRGPLRSFDVEGVEKNAVPDKEVVIRAPDGRELTAQCEMHADRVLRITVDEPRSVMHGTFVFHVKYSVDLVAAQELVRDGAMWRLSWKAPVATEGFDGARFLFALPAAPTEPRVLDPETGAPDASILATLHRTPENDEIELVRSHVARGEAAAWAMRIDPRAFPRVSSPQLRPPPPAPPPPPDRLRDSAWALGVFAIVAAYGLLVWTKERAFASSCRGGAKPRPLVPLPAAWRGFLAGAALAGAIALEITAQPTAAAVAIAVVIALALLRAEDGRVPARGPGKWLAIRPEEAFDLRASQGDAHWLDIGSRAGKVAASIACVVVAALGVVASRFSPEGPYLVALDGAALLPLFFTGLARQLAPDLARAHAPFLRALFRRLRKPQRRRRSSPAQELRVVPWARVPTGMDTPDELRLLVLPRVAMPGLLAIEVGMAWGRTPTGYVGSPEVLVRVQELSSAAARVASLAPSVRAVPGRREGERVYSLAPRVGTRAGTAVLVERLASELVDRRVRIAAKGREANVWSGAERRNTYAEKRAAAA